MLITLHPSSPSSSSLLLPNFYNDYTTTYNCKNRYSQPGSHPRFMVLGVHKGGSTALYSYLSAHGHIRPAVCKEIHFFDQDDEHSKGKSYYLRHYIDLAAYNGHIITGEGSPSYIRNPKVPGRVQGMLGGSNAVRFFVTLREPSTRFESNWVGSRERGKIRSGCERTWNESLAQLEQCYSAAGRTRERCEEELHENAVVRSIYVSQLERWLAVFPASQFMIIQSESMFADRNSTVQQAARFLGVREYTDAELASLALTNQGSSHATQAMILRCSPELKRRMDDFYVEHNLRLLRLLERHFPATLTEWKPTWYGWGEKAGQV